MNYKTITWINSLIILLLLIFLGIYFFVLQPQTEQPTEESSDSLEQTAEKTSENASTTAQESLADEIQVYSPQAKATITSPVEVTGQARGTWYFEGDFPVILTNWDGLILAQEPAQAQDDWMTEEFVEFSATLEFEEPANEISNRGYLILQKDNPSGLPENDAALEIPIYFE